MQTKLMICGGISSHYKTQLVLWEEGETMDAHSYFHDVLIGTKLFDGMTNAYLQYGGDWFFQQDNASPHSAEITKRYLDENGWDVLPWPA